MGNKSGKFNVHKTAQLSKDVAVVNETDVQVDEIHDVNVEEIKADIVNNEESKTELVKEEETKTAVAPKKKNVMSWFKSVSIRKEKKPKVPKENGKHEENLDAKQENGINQESPKENGVHHEIIEMPKENTVHDENIEVTKVIGDIEELEHAEVNAEGDAVIVNCHEAVDIDVTTELIKDAPQSNGHENNAESSDIPVEEH